MGNVTGLLLNFCGKFYLRLNGRASLSRNDGNAGWGHECGSIRHKPLQVQTALVWECGCFLNLRAVITELWQLIQPVHSVSELSWSSLICVTLWRFRWLCLSLRSVGMTCGSVKTLIWTIRVFVLIWMQKLSWTDESIEAFTLTSSFFGKWFAFYSVVIMCEHLFDNTGTSALLKTVQDIRFKGNLRWPLFLKYLNGQTLYVNRMD